MKINILSDGWTLKFIKGDTSVKLEAIASEADIDLNLRFLDRHCRQPGPAVAK